MHYTASNGHADAVVALVKNGANLNMRTNGKKHTPLQVAINKWGYKGVVVLFLQKAAKWHAKEAERKADELFRRLGE